jgi:hypothetical protein
VLKWPCSFKIIDFETFLLKLTLPYMVYSIEKSHDTRGVSYEIVKKFRGHFEK